MSENKKILIISRHSATIQWLLEKFPKAEVISHFKKEMSSSYDIYIGNLPLHLIYEIQQWGKLFLVVELPRIVFSQRGKDMSPKEIQNAGAKLVEYKLYKPNGIFH